MLVKLTNGMLCWFCCCDFKYVHCTNVVNFLDAFRHVTKKYLIWIVEVFHPLTPKI